MKRMKPGMAATLRVVPLLAFAAVTSSAAPEPLVGGEVRRQLTDQIEGFQLPETITGVDVDLALLTATGTQEIIIRLKSPSVAVAAANGDMTPTDLLSHKAMVENEQANFMQRTGTSSAEITCLQKVLNAVFLEIDASEVAALAADPDVESIHRVVNYEMHLSETVPYIGGTIVQNQGYDGTGVTVAVLDGGIDYTHIAFGGEGTIEAYQAAYKDFKNRDGLFPTDKVIGGIDFVGETWPDGPLLIDDDPIDLEGHGTSVADIFAGKLGVAPGALIHAVKVCSAISSACSGIAILQGFEYALDPNGDGDMSDAVDVINISIGTSYGLPFDEDTAQAANAVSALGVLVVASAGNDGDKPYITATAGAADSVLSVANTQVPSASLQIIEVSGGTYDGFFQLWSAPLESTLVGQVQYGDGQGNNLDGCADFEPGSLVGKIVLVDRGECNFTLKISKITLAGGLAGIIGLIAEGAPFAGGDGGDEPTDVPAYMISLEDADAIKGSLPDAVGTLDPDNVLSLVMTMDSSSSRGPQNDPRTLIKPEIGAPGSSTAAAVGEGTGTRPFSGTSGAAPMVAGSAALLLQKYPFLTPPEVKARLMNTAEVNIDTGLNQGLAPITRIGGGEVRVDKAITARAAAWDEDTLQGALSFGFIDVFETTQKVFKRLHIRNYSDDVITYDILPTFRYDDDEESGAVTVAPLFPGAVRVGPKEDRTVTIVMTINGEALPNNFMNSGSQGNDGSALSMNEFDGYLILDDGEQPIHLAWHVLPRKAANVVVDTDKLDFSESSTAEVTITNNGVGIAQIDTFSLIAVSPNVPEGGEGENMQSPDIRAVGVTTSPVGVGICSESDSFLWRFAISNWERTQHLFNVRHVVFFDTDRDGTDDYVALNNDYAGDQNFTILDGRQLVSVVNLSIGDSSAAFFAEHSTNTANTVLTVCAEQIGLSLQDFNSTNVDVRVEVLPIYGGRNDEVTGLTVTPGAERFVSPTRDLGFNESDQLLVVDRGAFVGNTRELGLMLITNADRGIGNRGGATQETELILLGA